MTAARHGQQVGIRTTIMRGGTSKGLYFHAAAIPPPGPSRDQTLLRLMGSPDVLQIDGLGGSRPITSKVAIIEQSERPDADVDYTFAQVDIEQSRVHWNGNCGNISSGVGPFAVDEGLVVADPDARYVDVRIHNTNTNMILTATVPITDGTADVIGDCAIPGVPGTGAEIIMDWSATIGSSTGRLLPTRNVVDEWRLSDGRRVAVTIVDVGNPTVWISAEDIDATGGELPHEIDENQDLRGTLREIRGRAAAALGLAAEWRLADTEAPGIPLLGMVSPPANYHSLNADPVLADDMDLRVRLMFMGRLHESLAGTASVNLAAASRVRGSIVSAACRPDRRHPKYLHAGHPSGVMGIRVVTADTGTVVPEFRTLGISRTARRIADATTWIPHTNIVQSTELK